MFNTKHPLSCACSALRSVCTPLLLLSVPRGVMQLDDTHAPPPSVPRLLSLQPDYLVRRYKSFIRRPGIAAGIAITAPHSLSHLSPPPFLFPHFPSPFSPSLTSPPHFPSSISPCLSAAPLNQQISSLAFPSLPHPFPPFSLTPSFSPSSPPPSQPPGPLPRLPFPPRGSPLSRPSHPLRIQLAPSPSHCEA
ncbi:unnamed protein product [Closterium sp. Naga37s-1]|nr:unnamed protein product [Closterium sp. Naga37s-1]